MRSTLACVLVALLVSTTVSSVTAFQTAPGLRSIVTPTRRPSSSRLSSWNRDRDDDTASDDEASSAKVERLVPKTSFGAEAVPEGQRPINEYLDVLQQPFFGWASLESGTKGLVTRLAILYSVVFATVCYPISSATYTQDGYLLQKLASSNVGAILLLLVFVFRLYSGWGYVGSRLTSKVIEFEETGWYDGDIEYKTETELQRDRLLFNSEVKPVVERLKLCTLALAALSLASFVALNVAMSAKPLFDEYNPDNLARMQYDDKLAETAAANSAGRPTYCDSRYYRAVAGGSGCN